MFMAPPLPSVFCSPTWPPYGLSDHCALHVLNNHMSRANCQSGEVCLHRGAMFLGRFLFFYCLITKSTRCYRHKNGADDSFGGGTVHEFDFLIRAKHYLPWRLGKRRIDSRRYQITVASEQARNHTRTEYTLRNICQLQTHPTRIAQNCHTCSQAVGYSLPIASLM